VYLKVGLKKEIKIVSFLRARINEAKKIRIRADADIETG
jgi:hypothetical protein